MYSEAKEKTTFHIFDIPLLAVVAALAIMLLIPALGDGGMYFLFLTAVIFSALRGDWRSGAFAVVISLILNFFLLYYHDKLPRSFNDWTILLAFILAAIFTVYICYSRMQAEKARLFAESRYRAIFEEAITGIYETTIDGKYKEVNPKLAEILGYASPAELMCEAENLDTRFYVEPGRRAEFQRLIEKNESVAGFESEIYRRDGSTIWISENALGCRDKSGKLVGFQGTTIEITVRKHAEAALERAHAELEEKVVERTAELNEANKILRGEINERRRIENELRASQKQFQDLSAHLQLVREEERKYIARELHDELGQSLTALKIDLVRLGEKRRAAEKSLSAVEIKTRITTMLEIVDAAMDMTRKIVAELRPGVLDELGLAAAMEWQVGEFQKRTKIVCNLEIEFNESGDCQNLKTTIFRILQECLTNIARHSGASHARITLQEEDYRIVFQAEDNGRGFEDESLSNPHSFGILGMRERARLLDGTVEVSRVENGGTHVSVSIPRRNRQAGQL